MRLGDSGKCESVESLELALNFRSTLSRCSEDFWLCGDPELVQPLFFYRCVQKSSECLMMKKNEKFH